MVRSTLSQLARQTSRTLAYRTSSRPLQRISRTTFQSSRLGSVQASRSISTIKPLQKGLSPETDDPQPKVAESNDTASAKAPADLTPERFHELSDVYLNALVEKLEQLQEESEQIDVEYSVCSIPILV